MVVFFNCTKLTFLTPPNCDQISTSSFLHPTQNFKEQCIAESDFKISTLVPVKKPVSRSYPKIIGFWTSSGRILPKLCQSDVQTHVYWCLKYDTLWWLIWGHITKCYNSACGWLKQWLTPQNDGKWTQLLIKIILHLSDDPFMFLIGLYYTQQYLQLYTCLRHVSKLKRIRLERTFT